MSRLVAEPEPEGPTHTAYLAHHEMVRRVLYRLGIHQDAIEDAVQDVFLVMHRRRGEFEGRSTLRTWLCGIARHIAHGYHSRRARRRRITLQTVTPLQPCADLATPECVLAERESLDQVRVALERMPPERREVLELMHWGGFSGAEVADRTGVCRNTVYSRLRLARRALERAAAR